LNLKLKLRKNIPCINEEKKTQTDKKVSKCAKMVAGELKVERPLRISCPVHRILLELTGEAEEIAE